jgi:hypothetical protein
MVICHDNTKAEFNVKHIVDSWKLLWRVLVKHGLTPVAHYGDGDPRFRAAALWLGLKGDKGLTIEHPLVNLHMQAVEVEDSSGNTIRLCIGAGVDPLHVQWRCNRQFLDADRTLCPGGQLAEPTHIKRFQQDVMNLGINHAHMNYNNKTNWGAVLKFSDHKLDKYGAVVEANHIRYHLKKLSEARVMEGTLVYLEFMNKFVGVTWRKCRSLPELIHDIVWCMLMCLIWEEGILKETPDPEGDSRTLKEHCLTRPTLDDIQIYMQELLLGIKHQQKHDPSQPFLVDRRSSRFAEYLFGDLRMAIRGQMKFSSKSALRLMQISLTKYCAEMSSDVVTHSLRRYKHCESEEKHRRTLPQGYWDFDIEQEIEVGV